MSIDTATGYLVVAVETSPVMVRVLELATCPSEAAARRTVRAFPTDGDVAYYVLPWDRRDPGGDRAAFVLHLDRLLGAWGLQVEAIHGP